MFRPIEVRLALRVVWPLVSLIRELVAIEEKRIGAEHRHARQHGDDLRALVGLFGDEFSKEGIVSIDRQNAPRVLRAGAALRLRLRAGQLAHIPDAHIESGEGLESPADSAENRPALCYLFLATLQEYILQYSLITPGLFVAVRQRITDVFAGNRRSVRAVDFLRPSPGAYCTTTQVVVLNDPVNLMTYVTAVFRIVLGLPKREAEQRMREVHELKQSVVWVGNREGAETYATELRFWHLNVRCQEA